MKTLICLIVLLASSGSAQFVVPIEGIENRDWFIVNYVDHDTTAGQIRDYQCSNLTYDGHWGTDFVIRDFSQMDSGVYILAAADGRVYFTKDGEFDRSKQQDTGGYGNFISINHGDSLYTLYAHLKKNSLLVKVGDSVMQGQRIAKVGSSGRTTDPHLHFEVYKNGFIIDPFGKQCVGQPEVPSMFTFTPHYDNDLQYINSAVASGILGLDSIRENPRQTFFTARDSFITYWSHGVSLGDGNIIRTDWYEPSGTLWFSFSDTANASYRYWYYSTYINGPAIQTNMPLGSWKVKFTIQDIVFDSLSFEIRQLGIHTPQKKHLSIHPNPARDFVVVSGDYKDIQLFDALGREVKLHINYNTKPIRIGLDGLPSGAYNLQLDDASGEVFVEKVIVK